MGILVALIATALCAVVYVRMVKREIPEPIGKMQAAVPIGFGLLAVVLVVPMLALIGLLIKPLLSVIQGGAVSPVISSLIRSFFLAGFTEEFLKFLMFLIVLRIVKPKNVYEYGFLCAGIGVGFTFLEDIVYGAGTAAVWARIFFFGMHILFGLLMGTQLGLAKYSKQQGKGDAGKHLFLAFFLPILWHTVFDASTITNAGLYSEDESAQIAGVVVALAVCAISIGLQIVLLIRFKKKTEEYCGIQLKTASSPVSGDEA